MPTPPLAQAERQRHANGPWVVVRYGVLARRAATSGGKHGSQVLRCPALRPHRLAKTKVGTKVMHSRRAWRAGLQAPELRGQITRPATRQACYSRMTPAMLVTNAASLLTHVAFVLATVHVGQ